MCKTTTEQQFNITVCCNFVNTYKLVNEFNSKAFCSINSMRLSDNDNVNSFGNDGNIPTVSSYISLPFKYNISKFFNGLNTSAVNVTIQFSLKSLQVYIKR